MPADYEPGFSLGLRLGYGIPFGSRARFYGVAEPMGPSGNFVGMLPVWGDAGYRVSKLVYLGAYFQYGILFVAKEHGCPDPLTSCRAHDLRGGAGVHFHFMPDRGVDPWAGLGLGYEASTTTFEGVEQSATRSNGGFEFANIQVGVDFHPVFGLDWGPFVSFSIDEYTTETQTLPDGSTETYSLSGANAQTAFHYFLTLGMRVQFDL